MRSEEDGETGQGHVYREGVSMGKMSRNKGKRAELELMHILNEMYGFDVRRGDCFRYEPDLVNFWGIHPEVKRSEDVKLSTWLHQAVQASMRYHDGIPAVFHRKSREPWFVSMLKQDFHILDPHGDAMLMPVTGKANPVEDCQGDIHGVVYFRKIGDVVTMPLKEWVGFYADWEEGK